jgi:SAM-dependent methyltransferase
MTESYNSIPIGFKARYREFKHLLTFHKTEAENRVSTLAGLAEQCGHTLKEEFGFELSGRKVLDVGPGQYLIQSRYFALRNEVIAIDNEVIVERLTAERCREMMRRNGIQRTVKTIARKALGIDRAYERAQRERFGVAELPKVAVTRGDASKMPFANESFDMIYSRAVLHSLEEPAAAISEMARVLRPGGVAHVDLHLYSSVNGSLDPRVMYGRNVELYWEHLRPGATVAEGVFLNRLRLSQWEELFANKWHGSKLSTIQVEDPALHKRADQILAQNMISGYSREELLTTTVVAVWQKARGTRLSLDNSEDLDEPTN